MKRRRGFRLGVGSSSALSTLIAAAILTVLVVVALVQRWNVIVIVIIAIAWAIVVAGFVIVPIAASSIAKTFSQFGGAGAVVPPPPGPPSDDAWREQGPGSLGPSSLSPVPDGSPGAPAAGALTIRRVIANAAPGYDWMRLVQGVAVRLEEVLGEGFSAEAEGGPIVVLRHISGISRRVNLGSSFQPPPLDVAERAMRGCLKMMDEAQMFAMRVQRDPWPSRGGTRESGPGNLARPRVRLEDGEIAMSWADGWGTMLRLPPLPFEGASPAASDTTW